MENELLVFFECQCRGVKFYELHDVSARYGTPVTLQPEPTNGHDPFCVAAFVPGKLLGSREPAQMLGHIARKLPSGFVLYFLLVCELPGTLDKILSSQVIMSVFTELCLYTCTCVNIAMWFRSLTREFQGIETGDTGLWIFTFL